MYSFTIVNRDTLLLSSQPGCHLSIFLPYSVTSSIIWNKCVEQTSILDLDFRGKVCSLSPLSMTLAVGFLYALLSMILAVGFLYVLLSMILAIGLQYVLFTHSRVFVLVAIC